MEDNHATSRAASTILNDKVPEAAQFGHETDNLLSLNKDYQDRIHVRTALQDIYARFGIKPDEASANIKKDVKAEENRDFDRDGDPCFFCYGKRRMGRGRVFTSLAS